MYKMVFCGEPLTISLLAAEDCFSERYECSIRVFCFQAVVITSVWLSIKELARVYD